MVRKSKAHPNEINSNSKPKIVAQKIEYSGLIPPPNMMEEYERICPGAMDRILKMTENQLSHTQQLEVNEHESIVKCRDKALENEIRFNNLGQLYGFIIILCCVIGGFILILNDKPIGGYATIITSILTVIGSVFYRNKKSNKNN